MAATHVRVMLGADNIIRDFDVVFRDDKTDILDVFIGMLVAGTFGTVTCDGKIVNGDDSIICAFDLVTDVSDSMTDDLDSDNSGRTAENPDIRSVDGKSCNSDEVVDEGKDNSVVVIGFCSVDGLDMVITDNIVDNLDTATDDNITDSGDDGAREIVTGEVYVLTDVDIPSELDMVGDKDITTCLDEVIGNVVPGNLEETFIDSVKTILDVLGTEDLTKNADELIGEGKNIDLVMLTDNVLTDKLKAFKGDIVTGNSDVGKILIDKVLTDKWDTDVTRFTVVLELREMLKITYEVSSVAINDFCELSGIILELVNSFETGFADEITPKLVVIDKVVVTIPTSVSFEKTFDEIPFVCAALYKVLNVFKEYTGEDVGILRLKKFDLTGLNSLDA